MRAATLIRMGRILKSVYAPKSNEIIVLKSDKDKENAGEIIIDPIGGKRERRNT